MSISTVLFSSLKFFFYHNCHAYNDNHNHHDYHVHQDYYGCHDCHDYHISFWVPIYFKLTLRLLDQSSPEGQFCENKTLLIATKVKFSVWYYDQCEHIRVIPCESTEKNTETHFFWFLTKKSKVFDILVIKTFFNKILVIFNHNLKTKDFLFFIF